MKKLTKDEYYMNIAREVSRKSKCFRNTIGAVIVRDDQVVATGYLGAPRKTMDSFEHGFCLRTKLKIPHGHRYEICRSVHAEMNAIINTARAGVSLLNGDMYIYGESTPTGEKIDTIPCFICKKIIINAGINRVICSMKEGGLKIFSVSEWVKEWQEKDIIDDEYQYGVGRKVVTEDDIKNLVNLVNKEDE